MSDAELLVGLATTLVLGIGAQWIGRRTQIPSLLLLLPAGLLAGDVLGLVDPVAMFGDILNPMVMLLVGLLLFQSGIQLHLKDLPREARSSVFRLVSIGALVTFAGATAAVALALDVPTELAFLTGAILVVSGPTVVGPLLGVVRPREPTGKILLWEGTVLDPIGAILGVVVLSVVVGADSGRLHPLLEMLARLGLGLVVGLAAAAFLVFVMSRFLVTDDMEAAVALMVATAAFAVADVLLSEAGLFATVILGIAVANQRVVSTRNIKGFGETLEVLIIGVLFILLGALAQIDALIEYAGQIAVIVAILVLVVRPLTVALALAGTPLRARDRAVIGWMDPRGIVAAATAAAFTATLVDTGYEVDFLLPVTFGVIFGTGVVYGLTARPVAALLGARQPAPTAVGLLGDDPWMVPLATELRAAGVDTLLITTAPTEVAQPPDASSGARLRTASLSDGIRSMEQALTEAELAQALVSLEPDTTLTLLESSMVLQLGRRHVLRVPHRKHYRVRTGRPSHGTALALHGEVTRADLRSRFQDGAQVRVLATPIPDDAVLLAEVQPDGMVDFNPEQRHAEPRATLIGLV